jgi:hypothetical protein
MSGGGARAYICVIEHAGVNGDELLILIMLARHAHEDGGGIWTSQATIAREAAAAAGPPRPSSTG